MFGLSGPRAQARLWMTDVSGRNRLSSPTQGTGVLERKGPGGVELVHNTRRDWKTSGGGGAKTRFLLEQQSGEEQSYKYRRCPGEDNE